MTDKPREKIVAFRISTGAAVIGAIMETEEESDSEVFEVVDPFCYTVKQEGQPKGDQIAWRITMDPIIPMGGAGQVATFDSLHVLCHLPMPHPEIINDWSRRTGRNTIQIATDLAVSPPSPN